MANGVYKPLRCRVTAKREDVGVLCLELLVVAVAFLVAVLSVGAAHGKEVKPVKDLFTSPAYCLAIDWKQDPPVAKVVKCKKG